ncbi:MAG: dihydrofolate reductase family protein [Pleomorphochaeta sp.]
MSNIVYIGVSIDGFIADRDNKIDFLEIVDNPNNDDLGFNDFIERIDAIVMGRNTFETVLSFNIDWPYQKPVFVCSTKLKESPPSLINKVFIINKNPKDIVSYLNNKGFNNLYIDGGNNIQNFLSEDLIDEMVISRIPVLLGSGVPLFNYLPKHLEFKVEKVDLLLNQIVSTTYIRKK